MGDDGKSHSLMAAAGSGANLFYLILGLKAGCVEIIYFTRRSSRRPKKNATLRPLGGV